MKKKSENNNFEENLDEIDNIIENLENGELGLDASIEEYEKAMRLIKNNSELLNKAKGKIIKVTKNQDKEGELDFEEV
ncbi:MAG: exodeoxyribonuclease VII small subunit [Fusobacteriaceae bacterium]